MSGSITWRKKVLHGTSKRPVSHPHNRNCTKTRERALLLMFFHQLTNVKTYVGLMLIHTQFLAYFMTYDVMPS